MDNYINICTQDKLNHYKKGTYSGSHCGMRYYIASREEEGKDRELLLCVWPEPYCLAKTAQEKKMEFYFPFTEDGLCRLEEKLNLIYEEKKTFWEEHRNITTTIM